MRPRLKKLQETKPEDQKLEQHLQNYEKIDRILYHQGLPFVTEAISAQITCHHQHNPRLG